jgi:uncharacterized protein YecA (UPF0149 family)
LRAGQHPGCIIPNITPVINGAPVAVESEQKNLKEVHENARVIGEGDGSSKAEAVEKKDEIGRNELCPCGSGKKYKKCGAVNSEEHQKLSKGK